LARRGRGRMVDPARSVSVPSMRVRTISTRCVSQPWE
jgi:hypothetical protein